jgi:hypothetical protein
MNVLNDKKIEIIENRYLYLDVENKDIRKMINIMYISDDRQIDKIDVEINENLPNILVYKNKDNVSFDNIFGSVRVLITDMRSIKKGLYKTIPEFIERVIINNVDIGDIRKNKINLVEFIDEKEVEDYIISEFIEKEKYNEITDNKSNLLIISIKKRVNKIHKKLIEKMDDDVIYMRDKNNKNALEYALEYCNEKLAVEIINKIKENKEFIEKNIEMFKEIVKKNRSHKITGNILKLNNKIKESLIDEYKYKFIHSEHNNYNYSYDPDVKVILYK